MILVFQMQYPLVEVVRKACWHACPGDSALFRESIGLLLQCTELCRVVCPFFSSLAVAQREAKDIFQDPKAPRHHVVPGDLPCLFSIPTSTSSLLFGLVELLISFQRLFNAVAQQIWTFSKARKPSYVTLLQDLYVGLAPHTAPAIFSLLQVKLSPPAGLCSCGCR